MAEVRMTKRVSISDMPFPTPIITLDNLQRVIKLEYSYESIKVTYNTLWQGETNFIDTYTQLIEDNI